MFAYIVRRLLLIIPTLFAIMVINFAIIQIAPGGAGGAGDRGAHRLRGGCHGAHLRRGPRRGRDGEPVRHLPARRHQQVPRRPRPRPRADRAAGKGVRLRQAAARALPPHDGPVRALRLRVELLPRRPRGRSGPRQAAGLDLAWALDHAAGLPDLDSLGYRQGGARRPALRRLDQRGHHRSATRSRTSSSRSC